MVMIRTTSSVSSATVASISICSSVHRVAQVADERPQPSAAGGGEQPRLVDDREQVRGALVAVGTGQRELDQAGALDDAAHDLGEREPRAHPVQVAQLRERVVDRGVGPRSGSGRTASRLGAVADEALVVDRERARAQRADEREPVGRVVDRGEHPDQVAHLLALEEVARALVPVRDAGAGERVLVVSSPVRAGSRIAMSPHRHGRQRPAVVAVADLPALAVRRREAARRSCAPPRAQLIGLGLRVKLAEREHDRRPLRARRVRRLVELDVRWLHARLAHEDVVEYGVERGEQLRVRAEVRRDLLVRARERAVSHLVVDGDVGAAEAVDRLLRVADDRQPARRRCQRPPVAVRLLVACQEQRELRLDRIGVLELVDQHDLVAAPEVVARRLVRAQQVARPEQQVVEVRLAGGASLALVVVDELLDPRQQAQQRVGAQPLLGGVVRVSVLLLERLQLLLALAPVRLRAHA